MSIELLLPRNPLFLLLEVMIVLPELSSSIITLFRESLVLLSEGRTFLLFLQNILILKILNQGSSE